MEYDKEKKQIIIKRELSNLDRLVLNFLNILCKHAEYVIVSGYVSILLGRARATEDVDIFIERIAGERFFKLYEELKSAGFWCLNAEQPEEVFNYLKEGMAVRFARQNNIIPNFEIRFPRKKIDDETFKDTLTVILPWGKLRISSLERQIAFKRYYLKSNKDIEDALHIETIFKEQMDYEKIKSIKKELDAV